MTNPNTMGEAIACPHCGGTGKLAPEQVTLGAKVLIARRAAGLTQLELAAAAMMSRGQLANIETDRTDVPTKTLMRLADALHVKAGDLLP